MYAVWLPVENLRHKCAKKRKFCVLPFSPHSNQIGIMHIIVYILAVENYMLLEDSVLISLKHVCFDQFPENKPESALNQLMQAARSLQ